MSTAYLTIDDAPSDTLPEKIAVLEEYDVPALFFCEGRRLAEFPEHARQAAQAGFHLGNHTYSHRRASELSIETFRDEIARTESLLEAVYDPLSVSRLARTFRFPFGDRGGDRREDFQRVLDDYDFAPPASNRITYEWYDEHHAGNRDWFWTFNVEDWIIETRSELQEQIQSSADHLEHPSSDIVLFHDASNTTALFEDFIELLLDQGVEFVDPLGLLN